MSIVPLPEGFKPIVSMAPDERIRGENNVKTRYSQTFKEFLSLFILNHKPESLASKALNKVDLQPLLGAFLDDLYIAGCAKKVTALFYAFKQAEQFIPPFVEKVLQDYEEQKPHAYPMMVELLKRRGLGGYSLTAREPFDSLKNIISTLKELKKRGCQEAVSELGGLYYDGHYGSYENESHNLISTLSPRERFDAIVELVRETNHPWWQNQVMEMVYRGHIVTKKLDQIELELTSEEKKALYEEFLKIEMTTNRESFYISTIIECNGDYSSKFSLGLSKSERIDLLTQRAVNGYKASEGILFEHFCEGKELSTDKTVEERKMFIKKLLCDLPKPRQEACQLAYLRESSCLNLLFKSGELDADKSLAVKAIALGNTAEAAGYITEKYGYLQSPPEEAISELIKFAKLGNPIAEGILTRTFGRGPIDTRVIEFAEHSACQTFIRHQVLRLYQLPQAKILNLLFKLESVLHTKLYTPPHNLD